MHAKSLPVSSKPALEVAKPVVTIPDSNEELKAEIIRLARQIDVAESRFLKLSAALRDPRGER